jgi:pyridoxal phosphate enzyme (YggS family)
MSTEPGFVERLAGVESRVADACRRAGRAASDVMILPVGKKHAPARILEAYEAGVRVIGENRVQEARQKIGLCPGEIEWHMIGHLQSNKVRLAVPCFQMLHSVDSLPLLEAIDAACDQAGRCMPVCLQVNVSGESSKSGMAPDDLEAALTACGSLMHIDVIGLMTLPPFTEDPEGARPHFAVLRDLRDRMRERTGFELPELSMGMSHDFEVAVEEGATWLRLGSVLFGPRRGAKKVSPHQQGGV